MSLAGRASVSQRPLVIELVGPAGAGKSTLAQALRRRDPTIPPALGVWALPLPALMRSTIALLLAGVAPSAAKHPFSWVELKQLIRLHTLHRAVGRTAAQGGRLVVLDEGPVFALSWLRVRCRRDPASSPFAALWRRALAQWAETLDAVVTLDAPDPVLAERIRTRARPHAVKHEAPGHIYPFLAHYRAAIAEALATVGVANGTRRIDCSTAAEAPDHMAGRILSELAAEPSLC